MSNTFVRTTIVVNQPIEKKCFGYTISLNKKNPNQLIIKARSANGRGRGNAGFIYKDGTIRLVDSFEPFLQPLLTKSIKDKVNLTLDLIYGRNRDKQCELSKGLVNFQKPTL